MGGNNRSAECNGHHVVDDWSPSSWQTKPISQQPEYNDKVALKKAVDKVVSLPPLVHPKEIETLKNSLANAASKKSFLLQGGDCAERFLDCSKKPIENKFKILLQMSLVILWGARIPVIRLARMAGQFAKPRTSTYETVNGQKVYSFKGDNVNSIDPTRREPDPERLVQAYFHSAATLNYIRAMILGGVADLHNPRSWKLDSVRGSETKKEYETIIDSITDGLDFLKSINADQMDALRSVDLFTSHEGLLLSYEEALTEKFEDKYYNTSAHFLWIGDRTRALDGAHIEYFRGISNPIGVKIGPSMSNDDLEKLVTVLNPAKEPGRLTLITRYGCGKVKDLLPGHIATVKKTGIPVLWICDPCHGQTETTPSGLKTRKVEKMLEELLLTFEIHSWMGGVHLELTGDDVTECIGGSNQLDVDHLTTNYETYCDPRLNYLQSLDFAFAIASKLKETLRSK